MRKTFFKYKGKIAAILALGIFMTMPAMQASELPTNETVMERLNEGKYLGIPYFTSDKALANYEKSKEISNEIVGNETDDYEKAKLLYKWVISTVEYNKKGTNYTLGPIQFA